MWIEDLDKLDVEKLEELLVIDSGEKIKLLTFLSDRMEASGIEITMLSTNDPGPEWFGADGPAVAQLKSSRAMHGSSLAWYE